MVITVDKRKKPLGFCSEKRARILLEKRRACVYRYFPFTIIIKDADVRTMPSVASYRVKSKWINHYLPKDSKYKSDSPRPKGWLPPSVKSIGDIIINWVIRLQKLINITACSFEAVRFDTQLLDNPDISGVEYQQGTLFGYEIKEYLLDKYGHQCQYCGGASGDKVLEWEHIQPKSKGGSNSVKNATLTCHACNQAKGNRSLKEWLAEEAAIAKKESPKSRVTLAETRVSGIIHIMEGKAPRRINRYCAWANSSRRYTEARLFAIFGDVECSSGGKTKFNRTILKLPKDHHYETPWRPSMPQQNASNAPPLGRCTHPTAS